MGTETERDCDVHWIEADDCPCCGRRGPCDCEVEPADGFDPASGPWSGRVCLTHGRLV